MRFYVRTVWVELGTGTRGPLLAVTTNDDKVEVWDPETGDLVNSLSTGYTSAMAFGTGPGRRPLLAAGSAEDADKPATGRQGRCIVKMWDAEIGNLVQTLTTDHTGWPKAIAFGRGARGRPLLAACTYDGSVVIWELEAGTVVTTWSKPESGIGASAVAFGRGTGGWPLLAVLGPSKGVVEVRDPETGDLVNTLSTKGAEAVAFGGGAEVLPLLAVGTGSGRDTVELWDPERGCRVGVLAGHTSSVDSVVFVDGVPGRRLLASGSFDGSVRLWDIGGDVDTGDSAVKSQPHIGNFAFGTGSQGQGLLAVADSEGHVRVLDADTGDHVRTLSTGHTNSVVFYRGTGGRPLLASGGTALQVWDLERGVKMWDVGIQDSVGPWPWSTASSVAFAAIRGKRWLVTYTDQLVRVWDPDTGKLLQSWRTTLAGFPPPAVGIGARGEPLVAVGGQGSRAKGQYGVDGTVRVWELMSGRLIGEPLAQYDSSVTALAFCAGSRGRTLLVVGANDGSIRAWDADTHELIWVDFGHSGPLRSVVSGAWADRRPVLASGGDDRTLKFWDPDTGVNIATFKHRLKLVSLASDGTRFAVRDEEGLTVIDLR